VALGRVALDITIAQLGRAGPHVYVTELARALGALLDDRLCPIASRFAAPVGARRTMGDRLRTLGRDLWWHQIGVARAARRMGAALLHLPAGMGPVRRRLPTVLTIHDLTVLRFPELFRPWFRHYARVVLPRAARAADAIIAVSQASKADIVATLTIPEQRVVVVPNGVDGCFRPVPAESERTLDVRRRYGLPRDFVLTVGSVEPRKNLPRLLKAVAQLRARPDTADIALVHAGPDGWLAGDVSRTIRALDLSPAVRFLGYVPREELGALYGAARLCAYPSLYEGFGLPVAEAMACGCPVVTSNVSSLPEVAGDAALLVDPSSVDEIAAGIAALWTDPTRRHELSAKGRARASCFTWERTARETAALYEAVSP
jgi:glycosyltransferase involved in cell wall biosynthesis